MAIRALIVGLGQIGMGYDLHLDPAERVASHARAFTVHPRFLLAGAVDTDAGRRAAFAQAYQRPAYEDVATAFREARPDVVVIAVPTRLHAEMLRQVLAEQPAPKVIVCEKPLSYDLDEAREMVEACAAARVSLYVNYMRRSDPGVCEVKRRLAAGTIATPVKAVVWYSKGFLHNGSHFFNLLEYWLGQATKADILDAGRSWEGTDPEPDVRVSFASGTAIFLAAWEEAFSHYTIELLAPNGRLRYERGGEGILWQAAVRDPNFPGYTVLSDEPETIPSGMSRSQLNVAEQLAAAIEGGDARLCSGAEAVETLRIMHSIIEMR